MNISRKSFLQLGLAIAALGAIGVAPAVADEEADAFIRSMEDRTRAETNTATYRMVVTRPGESDREVVMQSWDDRIGDRSFIHILAPRRDKDTTFLKVEGNLWMYLPNLERDIKIPPAMMLNSWMGSDFTNDDLVNQSSAINDYDNTIIAREVGADGVEVVTIQGVAHLDAPVVWGRVVM
ncbi:MAG: outer membrane lipoprotein-sorting protein, partial [Alphaproteobacteria bacterium]|nr:outer membrane lipoprotein-sorting protein [Alphaproteobacteria bacterium]